MNHSASEDFLYVHIQTYHAHKEVFTSHMLKERQSLREGLRDLCISQCEKPLVQLDWCRLEAPHRCSSSVQLRTPAGVQPRSYTHCFYSIQASLFTLFNSQPSPRTLLSSRFRRCPAAVLLERYSASPTQAEALSYERKCIQGVGGHTEAHHSHIWSKARPLKLSSRSARFSQTA